jgi:hypothetical protein
MMAAVRKTIKNSLGFRFSICFGFFFLKKKLSHRGLGWWEPKLAVNHKGTRPAEHDYVFALAEFDIEHTTAGTHHFRAELGFAEQLGPQRGECSVG